MTTADLERIARGLIPTDRWTGWRITETGKADDGATIYAVVPLVDSLLDGKPVFRGSQRDCRRMYALLAGEAPTSRRAQASTLGVPPAPAVAPPGLTEAPDDQAGPRTRGPEPATAIDPAHQAVTGAP